MKYQALCIGNSSFDILIPMDGYPSENEKYTVNETIECGGGPAANAAYLLSLWGAECWFAGIAGDDACGGMIRGEFTGVSTNLSLMEFRKGYATPLSLILANTAAGTRTILHRKGNTAPLGFPPVPPEALKPSLILTDGHEPEAARAAMDAFPDAHTVLDAGSVRKGTLELSPLVDFLIASERFAADYCGPAEIPADTPEAAAAGWVRKLTKDFKNRAAVTLGDRGLAFGAGGDRVRFMKAFPVKAVDSTAAGDVFHGAFGWTVLSGQTWEEGLAFASAAAALSVQKIGGRPSIPRLPEVLAFIGTYGYPQAL